MRFLKSFVYLYLIIGIGFGVARFGWGALVDAMAEPEEGPFIAGVLSAALEGAIMIVMWAPTLVTDVILGGGDLFNWMLYS
jgi:hypothetical protein